MSINMDNAKDIPPDTEACYEMVASQEEIYLETTEEELRASLTSEPTTAEHWRTNREKLELDWGWRYSMTDANNAPRKAESLEEQLNHAAEELITGDSDDPPLSEEALVEMLRMASNDRKLGSI